MGQHLVLMISGAIAMAGLMALLLAFVLYLLKRNRHTRIAGLEWWALAPAFWLPATLLIAARGSIADFWSILVANALLITGMLLFYAGTRIFFGALMNWRLWFTLLGISVAGVAVTIYVYPGITGRLIVIAGSMMVMHVAQLRFLAGMGKSATVRYLQLVLVVHVLVLGLRQITALTSPISENILDPSMMQMFYLVSFVATQLLLEIAAVILAAERLRTDLEFLATRDGLTQTWNRRAFLLAEREIELCRRHGHRLSLLMMDLDHFKKVNDAHGHQYGDEVLRTFSQTTSAQIRTTDYLGRYGGEEFIVLLPLTRLDTALGLAERIRKAVAEAPPQFCTVSIGVTDWRGAQDNLDGMLARADEALYRAKQAGRNRVEAAP
jgi:diguanylate cyclase (GGDEF)-like protein